MFKARKVKKVEYGLKLYVLRRKLGKQIFSALFIFADFTVSNSGPRHLGTAESFCYSEVQTFKCIGAGDRKQVFGKYGFLIFEGGGVHYESFAVHF